MVSDAFRVGFHPAVINVATRQWSLLPLFNITWQQKIF